MVGVVEKEEEEEEEEEEDEKIPEWIESARAEGQTPEKTENDRFILSHYVISGCRHWFHFFFIFLFHFHFVISLWVCMCSFFLSLLFPTSLRSCLISKESNEIKPSLIFFLVSWLPNLPIFWLIIHQNYGYYARFRLTCCDSFLVQTSDGEQPRILLLRCVSDCVPV